MKHSSSAGTELTRGETAIRTRINMDRLSHAHAITLLREQASVLTILAASYTNPNIPDEDRKNALSMAWRTCVDAICSLEEFEIST